MKIHQTISIFCGLTAGMILGRSLCFEFGSNSKFSFGEGRSESIEVSTSVFNGAGGAAFFLFSSSQDKFLSAPWSNRIDVSEHQNVELHKAWLDAIRSWVDLVAGSSTRLNNENWKAEPPETEQRKVLRRLQVETESILGKDKATVLLLLSGRDFQKMFFSRHFTISVDRDLVAITPDFGPRFSSEKKLLHADSALSVLIGKLGEQ